ncbi:MAG: stage II sporulation protein M [Clostridia bacterium]|nr:stage II sporulation protein M [Clostridia bacterium]
MKTKDTIMIRIQELFREEKRNYLLILLLFLLGLLLGCVAAASSKPEAVGELKNYFDRFFSVLMLQGSVKSEAFLLSLMSHFFFAFWLWVCGWSVWSLPVGFLQVFLKGFRTGFTLTCLCLCYRLKGVLFTLIAILPQQLLLLPVICVYLVSQIHFARDRSCLRRGIMSPELKRQVYGHHILMTGLFLSFLFIISLMEGYVTPTLLQPLCNFFL